MKIILFMFICIFCSCCSSKKQIMPPPPSPVVNFDTANNEEEVMSDSFQSKPMMQQDELQSQSQPSLQAMPPSQTIKKIKQKESKQKASKIKKQTTTPNQIDDETTTTGLLKYDIPSKMDYRQVYEIRIRINRDTTDDKAIAMGLPATSPTVKIRTSETMEVLVVDPSPSDRKNFDISKNGDDRQVIETTAGDFTEWVFNVTPLHTGKLKLNVVVSIIKNGNKKQVVYFHDVTVTATKWSLVKNFWNNYWQWVIGTFLLPLIIFLYKSFNKKKSAQPSSD